MVFSGITASEAEIDAIAGANVDTAFDGDDKTASLLRAENFLNVETGKNWSDDFSGLDVDVKSLVTAFTASWVARDMINYNPDAMGRSSAIFKTNIIRDIINTALSTLKDKTTNQQFMDDA